MPAWRPDKDDPYRISGEILGAEMNVIAGDATCPIVLTINTSEIGVRRVWAWHTVLLNEIIRARPQVGTVLGIQYGGKLESENGRHYHSYRVAVAGDAGPVEIDYKELLAIGPGMEPAPAEVPTPQSDADDGIPF